MFSVICVYNDENKVNKYLLPSLKKQNMDFQLILIDNRNHQYSSAAKALNDSFKKTNTDSKYLMFVHQDIELPTEDWLQKAGKHMDRINDLGIAGVAGMGAAGGQGLVKEGDDLHDWHLAKPVDKPTPVQTVDECLAIIPRQVFAKQLFDAQVCDHWHLYAVDYALSVNKYNLRAYVLPLVAHHFSAGLTDKHYYASLKRVLKKHKKNFSMVYTTCGNFSTRKYLYWQKPGLLLKYFE